VRIPNFSSSQFLLDVYDHVFSTPRASTTRMSDCSDPAQLYSIPSWPPASRSFVAQCIPIHAIYFRVVFFDWRVELAMSTTPIFFSLLTAFWSLICSNVSGEVGGLKVYVESSSPMHSTCISRSIWIPIYVMYRDEPSSCFLVVFFFFFSCSQPVVILAVSLGFVGVVLLLHILGRLRG
jgi:hypothetical protein